MNVSDGSAIHVPNSTSKYDDTVQMLLFVMHDTARRDERN